MEDYLKQTVLNQIEITSGNVVSARFAKQVVLDDVVVASEWHRTMFLPLQDIDAQVNEVNKHLALMTPSYPPISETDIQRIKDFASVAWAGLEA